MSSRESGVCCVFLGCASMNGFCLKSGTFVWVGLNLCIFKNSRQMAMCFSQVVQMVSQPRTLSRAWWDWKLMAHPGQQWVLESGPHMEEYQVGVAQSALCFLRDCWKVRRSCCKQSIVSFSSQILISQYWSIFLIVLTDGTDWMWRLKWLWENTEIGVLHKFYSRMICAFLSFLWSGSLAMY